MEKVFLTKEEIKTITDLQTKEEKFISQLGTLEYQLQILLKQKFTKVHNVKPPSSRSDSSEKFVVAIGFRG